MKTATAVIGFTARPSRFALSRWKRVGIGRVVPLGDALPAFSREGFAVEPFTRGVGDFRDGDGRNLTWAVDRHIHEYAEALTAEEGAARLLPFMPDDASSEDARSWLRRMLTLELYESAPYWEAFMAWPERPRDAVFYERSPIVRDYLRRRHGILCEGPAGVLRKIAVLPRLAAALLLAPRPPQGGAPPTLAVPLLRGTDGRMQLSDLSWMDGSGIAKDSILFYNENPSAETDGLARGVRAEGYRYAPGILTGMPWKDRLKTVLYLCLAVPRLMARAPLSFAKARDFILLQAAVEYLRFHALWLPFFRARNVRASIDHGDTNMAIQAYVHALEKQLGGTNIMYEFSSTGFIPPQLSRPVRQKTYLARGLWTHDSMLDVASYTKLLDWDATFLFGLNKHFLRDRPVSSALSEALKRAEGKKKIAVLDVSCGRARLLPPSARRKFYDIVLDIARECPDSFFVVKPQRGAAFLDEYREKFQALEKEGRAFWAPAGIDATLIQPLFAAVDFAIGLGGHNSALIEAASEEVPHVYYDEWDCVPDSYAKLIPPEMLARTEDALRGLLKRVDSGAFSLDGIRGWREYLENVDPFRDAKGHERMGFFLKLWLDSPPFTDAQTVAALYRARWGDGSVLNGSR